MHASYPQTPPMCVSPPFVLQCPSIWFWAPQSIFLLNEPIGISLWIPSLSDMRRCLWLCAGGPSLSVIPPRSLRFLQKAVFPLSGRVRLRYMHEMDTFWVASRSRLAHGSGGRLGECGFANESFLLIVIFRIEAQECDRGFIGGCTFIFKGNFLPLSIVALSNQLWRKW